MRIRFVNGKMNLRFQIVLVIWFGTGASPIVTIVTIVASRTPSPAAVSVLKAVNSKTESAKRSNVSPINYANAPRAKNSSAHPVKLFQAGITGQPELDGLAAKKVVPKLVVCRSLI